MSRKRFPAAIRELREKYPQGTVAQVRLVLDYGSIIEFEGLLGAADSTFDRVVISARLDAQSKENT